MGPEAIEIGLEFAHIDYLVKEPFNLRAGILLLPIGKFNLLHDSPLNDLTDRPLVSRFVIPSTVSETGAGFYGTFIPEEPASWTMNSMSRRDPADMIPDGTPTINEANGTRGPATEMRHG